jgi:arylsulfatase A-like enzyme
VQRRPAAKVISLIAVAALAVLAGGRTQRDAAAREPTATQPNIVVIMVDDQPVLDGRLLRYEPVVRDQIAAQGATFTDFHSESPLCCPARVGYWTGQHTHNHGVTENVAGLFNPTMTLATQLHAIGYRTMLAGKYLNGYAAAPGPWLAPHVPPGWDDWAAMGTPAYYDYTLYENGGQTEQHGSQPQDYSTDVIASHAVTMIQNAPPSQPIFAWIAPFSAHTPFTPAPRYSGAQCDAADRWWDPPSYNEADVTDKPAWLQAIPLLPSGRGFDLTDLCRQMMGVNDLVTQVIDALQATGRLQSTLLVYAGDNGMEEGEHRLVGKTAPYITQVPFILRWPGVVAPDTTIAERLQNIDLAPTLCAIAGCTLGPYPNGQATPDGTSFLPLLDGSGTLTRPAVLDEMPAAPTKRSVSDTPPWEAVITTAESPLARMRCASAAQHGCRWHYIVYPSTGEEELYDDSGGPCYAWSPGDPGDPCELQNVAHRARYLAVLQAMRAEESVLSTERGGGATRARALP